MLFFQIPTEIEQEIHEFEDSCTSCDINRRFDSSLTTCPSVDCDDDSDANEAYSILQNQCTNSCESSTCASAFRTIRAYHDGCDESDISLTIEEGIHEFEELCEDQDCNVDRETNQLVCESDDDDDNNDDDNNDDDNNDDDNDDDESSSDANILICSVVALVICSLI